MHRLLVPGLLACSSLVLLTAASSADVIVRGPLGNMVVVGSSGGPPAAPNAKATSAEAPIVSTSRPVVRPEMDGDTLPPPQVLRQAPGTLPSMQPGTVITPGLQAVVAPILPRDFAKIIKPGPSPAQYEVLFLHPVSKQPVRVCFELPPGCPRVSYCCGSLVFDYGRHEVEVRFKLGGKVVVSQR